jgi:radical SAM superfamily enzyme YgiQ (UPF0313 family)
MRYEGTIYRPPPEADSYLLQCTIGCSHNRCTFCGMYKSVRYRIRSLNEIKCDIKMAKVSFGRRLRKVFLCDGDAISIDTEILLEILSELKNAFPLLEHISTYAGPKSTLNKSIEELKQLRAGGLTMTYFGIESGNDQVLKAIRKGTNSSEVLEAGQNIIKSGMTLASMVMLGIGGKGDESIAHALATAKVVNQMNPHYIGVLTAVPVKYTVLYSQVQKGDFQLQDAYETIEEMKIMLDHITIDNLGLDASHVSNFLPMKGMLQKDKKKLLDLIDNSLQNRDANLTGVPYVGRF